MRNVLFIMGLVMMTTVNAQGDEYCEACEVQENNYQQVPQARRGRNGTRDVICPRRIYIYYFTDYDYSRRDINAFWPGRHYDPFYDQFAR